MRLNEWKWKIVIKFYICEFEWVFVIEVPFIIDSKLLSKL